jgi:hypothetical protein
MEKGEINMRQLIRTLFIIEIFIEFTSALHAETIYAGSCLQDSVQAAINKAYDGDTVIVPEGIATWITKNPLTPAAIIDQKAITFMGAGEGKTTIYDETGNGYLECAIQVIGLEGKPFRITGFTIYLSTVDCTHGILNITGNCKNFRLDHCTFDNVTGSGRAIIVHGFGIIDHCTIICPENTTIQSISPAGEGDSSWVGSFALGTESTLFIEDCFFNNGYMNDNCLDANSGADYVFRYNRVVNTFPGHHGTDTGGEGHRAPHSFEIYNNTLTSSISLYTCGRYRGGTGVVYNNTFSGPFGNSLMVSSYRSCGSYVYWGQCDGTNPFDGNMPGMNGYPCLDQIGYATSTAGTVYQPQKSEPLYEWNNTLNGSDLDIVVDNMCDEVANHIKENRDFYNDTSRQHYIPYRYPHPLILDNRTGKVLDLNSNISDSSVELHWSQVDSVDSYLILRDWQEVATGVIGTSWSESAPAEEKVYMVYAIRSSDEKIFAAEGIIVNPTTSVSSISDLPVEFLLHQNYPNPFNPGTVISYRLPVNGFVSLKIYDILGKEISTLVDCVQTAED